MHGVNNYGVHSLEFSPLSPFPSAPPNHFVQAATGLDFILLFVHYWSAGRRVHWCLLPLSVQILELAQQADNPREEKNARLETSVAAGIRCVVAVAVAVAAVIVVVAVVVGGTETTGPKEGRRRWAGITRVQAALWFFALFVGEFLEFSCTVL